MQKEVKKVGNRIIKTITVTDYRPITKKVTNEIYYPLRVGKERKRVILDAKGLEVAHFIRGPESLANTVCNILNIEYIKKL